MAIVGTRVLDVVDWTPQLAAMIGIGVGIDYALLILNRFRLERAGGRDVRDATLDGDRHVGPRRAVRRHRRGDRDARHDPARDLVPVRPRDRRSAVGAGDDGRVADADPGAPGRVRPPHQAGQGRGRRRRRPRDRRRRALERLRRAPPAARGDRRARRADRAGRCPRCTSGSRAATPAHTRRATRRGSPTTCSSRASGPASTRPLLLAVELPQARRHRAARPDRRRPAQAGRDRLRPAAAGQPGRRHRDDDRLPDDHAAGRPHRRDRQDRPRRRRCRRSPRRPARASRSAARPRATSTSPRRSATSCRCSSASSSASRCCCSPSCSARS